MRLLNINSGMRSKVICLGPPACHFKEQRRREILGVYCIDEIKQVELPPELPPELLALEI